MGNIITMIEKYFAILKNIYKNYINIAKYFIDSSVIRQNGNGIFQEYCPSIVAILSKKIITILLNYFVNIIFEKCSNKFAWKVVICQYIHIYDRFSVRSTDQNFLLPPRGSFVMVKKKFLRKCAFLILLPPRGSFMIVKKKVFEKMC